MQTVSMTASTTVTLSSVPTSGNLLIAIGFNAVTTIGCASGWTAIRHVSASYVDAQDCYRVVSGDTTTETPFVGSAANIGGQIWEIAGQAASGFIDAQAGAESSLPLAVTLTFAPPNSGDLIVGASATNTKISGTTPLGFTTDSSFAPVAGTGFSDLSAHEGAAAAGTQSVVWAYAATDTHPVTAMMVAVDGSGVASTATPSPTPSPTPTPVPTPTPTPGGLGMSLVQTGAITGALGTTLHASPATGDLLIAIGFDGKSSVACASNWTLVRSVLGRYDKGIMCYRIVSGDTATQTPFAGTPADIAGEIWDITGQASSGFIDAQTGAESGPRTVTLSFAPSQSGDLIVGGSAINTKLTAITPTGFTADASSSPAGGTGFSDFAAHETNAVSGTQSVTWAYNSTTDTHPVTALMVAVFGLPAPTPSPGPSPADWLTMAYDNKRTGYNPNETSLGVSNAGGVHALWAQPLQISGQVAEPVYASNVQINGQPVNVLYVSSGSGQAIAINADTGGILWTHQMGTVTYMCGTSSFTFGANGAAAIDRARNRIYVPDGAAGVHALDMSTGAEISGWPVTIATQPDHNFIYSGVTYNAADGSLYAETSSTCDISPWTGRITLINTTTAAIVNNFFPAQGVSGGGIWGFGGASIDPSTNNVYIAVGNSDNTGGASQTAGYSEQVVELTPDLSTVLGNFYAQLPVGPDNDFGATPMLFQPPGCPLLAAAVNKSGLFVLYTASNISAGPTQAIQMSITSDSGDFIGLPAYDPVTNLVYVGLPATQGIYNPGLGAFSIQPNCTLNPTPAWSANFGADGSLISTDAPRSPISIANGVVYVSDYRTAVTYAFNAATGAQLWSQPLNGKGIVGPIVVNGHLYTSDVSGKINAWTP